MTTGEQNLFKALGGLLLFAALALVLSGCASKAAKPALPRDLPAAFSHPILPADLPVTRSLLALFRDERLHGLVREALDNNPDLRATALRLKASEHLLWETRSRFLPSADLSGSRGRDNHGLDPATGRQTEKNRYRAGLAVAWEADIWGKLADEHHARLAGYEQERETWQSAYDALAARVIQTWIRAAGAREAAAIQASRAGTLARIEQTITRRYRQGLGSLDELSSARTRTLVARADITRLNEETERETRALAQLLGRYPGQNAGKSHLPEMTLPRIRLAACRPPAEALKHRPDIRAALARAEAGLLDASAAEKARLPSLSLKTDLAREASSLSAITSSQTLWNLVAGITMPIFQDGRLHHQALAAGLEADARVQELKSLVLKAMGEVEDRAGREAVLDREETQVSQALEQAGQSTAYFSSRYSKGLENIQTLLIAVEQEMTLKSRLAEIRAARMGNRIDLALAAGIGMSPSETP